jgi:hypothetical protein
MQKITTLIVFIVLIISQINAQSDLLNATIIDKNGKEISGVIDYQGRGKSPRKIFFKAKDTPAKVILPIDIQGFTIIKKNERYISAILDLNKETLNELELKEFQSMKEAVTTLDLVRDTVFLLTLATGEINLYSLIDKNSKTHFFYQKGKAPIKELIYRKVKIGIKESVKDYQTMGEIKAYSTQLKMEVLDCPNAFSMIKEETFYYREYDLMRVVNKYNECKGKSTFIMPIKKNPITFYALAGINKVELLSQFSLGYDIDEKPISAINPVLGLGLDVSLGRSVNAFGLGFEMLYKPIKANLKSEEKQTGYLNSKEYNYNMSFLQLNALFRYSTQLADFQPYIKAGVGFALLMNTDNSLTEIRGFNNSKTITTPVTQNNRFNLCFALGMKKNKFYLEGRYDYGLNTSDLQFNKLKSNYLSLLLGYSLFNNRK